MKKNCYNCENLEWMEGETHDPNGYACNKRNYSTETQEEKHLSQLENGKYLLKSKVCFEPKD